MSKLSLFDKLKVLVDVASSSHLFIIALLLIISLAYLFMTTNKKNAKSSKITYIGIYLAIAIVTIVLYKDSLSKMFDYMMNNLFIVIYFPNLAIYFAAIITANIILWISIFNFKINKFIKYINSIVYCIIHYLLILIINVITTNKLDVFTQQSVYENKEALALIELSSSIFVIWILFLIVYKIIRKYQTKNEKEETTISVEKEKKRILPTNIVEVNYPRYVIDTKKVEKVKEEQKPQEDFSFYENMLTLEDYKLVLSILKGQKEFPKEEIKPQQLTLNLEEMVLSPISSKNAIEKQELEINEEKRQQKELNIEIEKPKQEIENTNIEKEKQLEKIIEEELEKELEQERIKAEREELRKMTELERLYSSIR